MKMYIILQDYGPKVLAYNWENINYILHLKCCMMKIKHDSLVKILDFKLSLQIAKWYLVLPQPLKSANVP